MKSLSMAMFRNCRFQNFSLDALRRPALGVPNKTTFDARSARLDHQLVSAGQQALPCYVLPTQATDIA